MAIAYVEAFSSFVPAGTGWQNYDIFTNLGVPKGAVAHILLLHSDTAATKTLGVRTDGSAIDRFFVVHEEEAPASSYSGLTLDVLVDAATGLIETYCDATANVIFYLLGYFTGVTYTEKMQVLDPTPQNTWDHVDLTPYGVSALGGEVCQIVMENTVTTFGCNMGVRADGSALSRLLNVHEAEGGGGCQYTNYVKSAAGGLIECFRQYNATPRDRFPYLVGFYDSSLDYQELWTVKDIINDASWDSFDLTADLDQDGRVVNVVIMNNAIAAGNTLGVRGGASAVNRYYLEHEAEGNGIQGADFCAQSDSSGIIKLYASVSASENTWLAGYFKFTPAVTAVNRAIKRVESRFRRSTSKFHSGTTQYRRIVSV